MTSSSPLDVLTGTSEWQKRGQLVHQWFKKGTSPTKKSIADKIGCPAYDLYMFCTQPCRLGLSKRLTLWSYLCVLVEGEEAPLVEEAVQPSPAVVIRERDDAAAPRVEPRRTEEEKGPVMHDPPCAVAKEPVLTLREMVPEMWRAAKRAKVEQNGVTIEFEF